MPPSCSALAAAFANGSSVLLGAVLEEAYEKAHY